LCIDEFEDEGVTEKSPVKVAQEQSHTTSAVSETSAVKEPRKESRKISIGLMEPRKRARDDEEYVPQPVRDVLN